VTRVHWSVDDGPESADAGTAETEGVSDAPARLLRFEITASSFCHQMVRSLVASLVDVGRGKDTPAGLLECLRATTRQAMAEPAPAHGLCLVSVAYGDS
jgi:tRNA pseudouridine38-40 synthase